MQKKSIIGIILALLSIGCISGLILYTHQKQSVKTGLKVVNCLYNFENYEQIYTDNMEQLKALVTDEVLKSLNYKDINRALTAYLKFRGNPSKVVVLDATSNHVIYKIDCESITPDRVFMLSYRTNVFGKITHVEEYELHAFYKGNTTNSNTK